MARILLPGDFVTASLQTATNEEKIVGTGLEKHSDGIYAVVCGMLHEKGNKLWVVTSTKRYIPHAGDRVLGVVSARVGDYFRVDIGAPDLALLCFTSFEGATKRNRPTVRVGDLIYSQVILSSKQFEPELSCVDLEGRARGLGVITTPGLIFDVTLNYARRLLSAEDNFLVTLGKRIKFEVTIGMNGKIWVSAGDRETLAVRDAIIEAEFTFPSNRNMVIEKAVHNACAAVVKSEPMDQM